MQDFKANKNKAWIKGLLRHPLQPGNELGIFYSYRGLHGKIIYSIGMPMIKFELVH